RMNYLLYIVLFTFWLLFLAVIVTQGSRFLEPFSIPMGLAAGISVGLLAPYVSKHIKNVKYCVVAMLVLVAAVSSLSIYGAYVTSATVVPGTDDGMYNSLESIKNTTSNNTVITSWWDFGYLFESAADRPVTFDGGSQNTPRAYWVGKALLTDNEALSAGILRMLTTSGDQGTLLLENYTKDTGKSVEILDAILPVSKQNAQAILINQYKFTPDQAQSILKYTHPDNPNPHVLITSSDMLGKAAWWSYFGSWNFQNGTGQHYIYSAAQASSQSVNGSTVITAQNGVVAKINGNNVTAGLNYAQGNLTQLIEPHRLTVVANNKVVQDNIVSNDSPISIVIMIQNNSGLAIVMNKELENSMFTRLFIFGGAGLTKFKMVEQQPGVMVWNVSSY
ncbi:MAG TPA: peptide transporter, partial [Methanobacterium sp.]|nr:peptide transporter [Methanobacterium sp.]